MTIRDGHVALDLPRDVSLSEAMALQRRAARNDGVGSIAADGICHSPPAHEKRFSTWPRH